MTAPTARDAILLAVRAARPALVACPDLSGAADDLAMPHCDVVEQFIAVARAAATEVVLGTRREVGRRIAQVAPGARRVLSRVDEMTGTVAEPDDPRALASLDLFVCEAELGVAENGAVWLPASRLGERSALFLAAQVVVVLDRATIVPTLHAAYARLDMANEAFGIFVAGPSKTADIEQSLVIGAHGPTRFTVILVA